MPNRYPPLQFDWSRLGDSGMYRAKPDTTFFLYAFRAAGGNWRWSISMLGEGDRLVPLYDDGPYRSLILAKLRAENWYREHGGNPMQQRLPLSGPLGPNDEDTDYDDWKELPF